MKKHFYLAILFNIVLFTKFKIWSVGKEFNSLTADCQWGTVQCSSRKACAEKCDKFHGFIIHNTTRLVCFHETKNCTLISSKDKETNKTQCGYQGAKDLVERRVVEHSCDPKVLCDYATDEECSEECDKYTVYITRPKRPRKYYVWHCGVTSQTQPRIQNLDSKSTAYRVTRKDRTRRTVYDCSCGIGQEGSEVQRAPINKPPKPSNKEKLVVSCPIILRAKSSKRCGNICKRVRGIYSPENEKFICFHSQLNVTLFQVTDEYCECGVTIKIDNKFENSKCSPERRIRLNNEISALDCPGICKRYKGYLLSPGRFIPDVVYCEFMPSHFYNNLSYEMGKIVIADSKKGTKYRRYECKCGLTNGRSIDNDERIIDNDGWNNESENSLSFQKVDISQNEEIDNVIENSDFIPNLNNEYDDTLRNDNDLANSIVGTKRKLQRLNSRDVKKIIRGKNNDKQRSIDEIAPPADLEIHSMSCHIPALQNNTHISDPNLAQNVGFDDAFIRNDEDMIENIIAVTGSPSIQDTNFFSSTSGIHDLVFERSEILPKGDFDPPSMSCPHTSPKKTRNACESLSQNVRFDHTPTQNDEAKFEDIFAVTTTPSIQNTNYISATSGIPDVLPEILPPEDLAPSSMACHHHTPLRNNKISNNDESGSCLYNTGLGCDMSQNMGFGPSELQNTELIRYDNASQNIGVINRNIMSSNDRNTPEVISNEANYSSISDEVSRRSIPDSTSLLFPNVTMEINEFINSSKGF